jgi:hypothetical protein
LLGKRFDSEKKKEDGLSCKPEAPSVATPWYEEGARNLFLIDAVARPGSDTDTIVIGGKSLHFSEAYGAIHGRLL